jgi:hypothetical protein
MKADEQEGTPQPDLIFSKVKDNALFKMHYSEQGQPRLLITIAYF